MRVWLLFRHFNIECEQIVIPLYTNAFEQFRASHYPVRSVPAVQISQLNQSVTIYDSLAITELLHEHHPDLGIWPSKMVHRAIARSLCAEMHSGFKALRATMPMNLKRVYKTFRPDDETYTDIRRIENLWHWARSIWAKDGPYLFGQNFTAADAFFVPVAERFRTYGIELEKVAVTYMTTLLKHPARKEFFKAAQHENWIMAHNEFDLD